MAESLNITFHYKSKTLTIQANKNIDAWNQELYKIMCRNVKSHFHLENEFRIFSCYGEDNALEDIHTFRHQCALYLDSSMEIRFNIREYIDQRQMHDIMPFNDDMILIVNNWRRKSISSTASN